MESCMPAARDDLVLRKVGDETLILDRAGERIHQLNASASYVWSRCDGQTSLKVVTDEFAARYDIPVQDAARDIAHVLLQLQELGLTQNKL